MVKPDHCPRCGHDEFHEGIFHDMGITLNCRSCGWQGAFTDRELERERRVTCDRCSTTVPLTRAITHGPVTDPDEVVCAACIGSEDRVI